MDAGVDVHRGGGWGIGRLRFYGAMASLLATAMASLFDTMVPQPALAGLNLELERTPEAVAVSSGTRGWGRGFGVSPGTTGDKLWGPRGQSPRK